MSMPSVPDSSSLPARIGRPALRALTAAGVTSLHDLSQWRESDLMQLHGVGARAVSLLRQALEDAGASLRQDR